MMKNRLPRPDERCVLCARPKAHVKHLVVGTIAAICSDCVRAATRILAERAPDSGAPDRTIRKLDIEPGGFDEASKVVVELDPDVAEVFNNSDSVNLTLRPLAHLIQAEAKFVIERELQDRQNSDGK